jgi:hypothetical protein
MQDLDFSEENSMAEITGMLLSDLLPDGTVTINFASDESNERIFSVKHPDLDTAQAYLVHNLRLTPQLAAAIRLGMERNKVVFLGMSIREETFAELHCTHA